MLDQVEYFQGVIMHTQGFISRRSFVLSATAMTAVLAAGAPAIRTAMAQDADYPELEIVAADYTFEMPDSVESGYTRLILDNQGKEDHHAILFRVNDDATMEQFQEALMSGDLGAVLAVSTAYGGPNVGPGRSTSVIAYLDPGDYMAVCVVPDPEGTPHAAHGMVAPLEVTAGDAGNEAPATDGAISMIDMAFVGLPSEVEAGAHTWEITNDGDQLHEIALLQLAPGMTMSGLMAILTGEEGEATPEGDAGAEGPPFESVAGTAPMSQGAVNYLEMDLEAGDYVAICFIPDIETGMPHFLMGMIAGFTVT